MTIKELQALYDYSYWANGKLFPVVSRLKTEEFTRNLAGSYGSVRNTLVHMLSAEAGWLDRCGGPKRGPKLKPEDYPTVESVIAAANRLEGQVRAFLAGLTDDDVVRTAEFINEKGGKRGLPLGEFMQHAANHGVHHRGQAALLLRALGHAPGNFDMLFYFAEKRGVPAF